MKPEIHYPTKPYIVNQTWGVYRPDIYEQFGFTNHNGEDFRIGEDGLLRAPFDGETVATKWQPEGGGLVVGFLSKNEYEWNDGVKGSYFI